VAHKKWLAISWSNDLCKTQIVLALHSSIAIYCQLHWTAVLVCNWFTRSHSRAFQISSGLYVHFVNSLCVAHMQLLCFVQTWSHSNTFMCVVLFGLFPCSTVLLFACCWTIESCRVIVSVHSLFMSNKLEKNINILSSLAFHQCP